MSKKNFFFFALHSLSFLIVLFNLKIAIQSISKKDILVKKIKFHEKTQDQEEIGFHG